MIKLSQLKPLSIIYFETTRIIKIMGGTIKKLAKMGSKIILNQESEL